MRVVGQNPTNVEVLKVLGNPKSDEMNVKVTVLLIGITQRVNSTKHLTTEKYKLTQLQNNRGQDVWAEAVVPSLRTVLFAENWTPGFGPPLSETENEDEEDPLKCRNIYYNNSGSKGREPFTIHLNRDSEADVTSSLATSAFNRKEAKRYKQDNGPPVSDFSDSFTVSL
ncbi:hypothetical protein STEG23_034480, partial [Scotinomys teguina]